jgi:hypothetical protein
MADMMSAEGPGWRNLKDFQLKANLVDWNHANLVVRTRDWEPWNAVSALLLSGVDSRPEGEDSGPDGVDSGPEEVDSGLEGMDSGSEGMYSEAEGVNSGPDGVDSGANPLLPLFAVAGQLNAKLFEELNTCNTACY